MTGLPNSVPVKRRDRRKWFLKIENLLLIAGIMALAFYAGARLYTWAYQSYADYSFEEQLRGRSPSLAGFIPHLFGKKGAPATAEKQGPGGDELLRKMIYAPEVVPLDKGWSSGRLRKYQEAAAPAQGSVLGRLEIPSLELSVMLLNGTDEWTLNRAVGHIEGTAFPGEPGNLGVAGHRDGFFRGLKDISKNTTVVLTTLKGRFFYRVNGIHVVKPTDVHLLAPTRKPSITLVTCYPFYYVGDAPKRYVVTAEMVKVQSPTDLAAEYSASR